MPESRLIKINDWRNKETGEKGQIFLKEEFQILLSRFSPLQEEAPPECRLDLAMMPFQRTEYRKGKNSSNSLREKPGKNGSHHQWCYADIICPNSMWWEESFPSLVFFTQTHNPSLVRKTSGKPQWKDSLQNPWSVLLKIVKAIGNKDSLRNCHRPRETKETKCKMVDPRWDSGTEKRHS